MTKTRIRTLNDTNIDADQSYDEVLTKWYRARTSGKDGFEVTRNSVPCFVVRRNVTSVYPVG